ncbi:hypothetical protein IG631_23189 [Alternaria alternata]|nr:hypothetical protein IG631_23189 [Alternaria alternata]
MELSLIDPGLDLLRRLRRMLIEHREIRGLGCAGKDGSRTAKESQFPILAPNRRYPDLLISQMPTYHHEGFGALPKSEGGYEHRLII